MLGNLGGIDYQQGRHREAVRWTRQALALFKACNDQVGEAHGLATLGSIPITKGDYQRAVAYLEQAIELFTRIGDQSGQIQAHNGLAEASQVTGHPSQARQHWQQALTLYAELNSPQADEISALLSFNSQTVSLASGGRGAFLAPTARARR